jgi:nucleoid DNA-binding protein
MSTKNAAKKAMTKTQLIQAIAETIGNEINKKQVKTVLEALQSIGHKALKRQGIFTLPGFAKFRVVKKPATKARKGINPFNGEEIMFKAKPASKSVRARPVKACKDAVG